MMSKGRKSAMGLVATLALTLLGTREVTKVEISLVCFLIWLSLLFVCSQYVIKGGLSIPERMGRTAFLAIATLIPTALYGWHFWPRDYAVTIEWAMTVYDIRKVDPTADEVRLW